MLEALIFDVDGTLADTERDGHRVAYNAAFSDQQLDWDWTPALYGELLAITGGKERIRYYLEHWRKDFRVPVDLDGFIAELHAIKTRHYVQLLREGGIALRSGVRRLLEEACAAGLRLAIATTTTPANVDVLLDTALGPHAHAWFDVIGAGDIVATKKPAPDIYEHVLRELRLSPRQCLALEDSEHGLRAAQRAAVACLVTVNDYTRDQSFDGALCVLDGLGEHAAPAHVLEAAARAPAGNTAWPNEIVVDVALLRGLV